MSDERTILPSFSWHALSAIALLFAQFVGVVIWAQNEHSSRLELEHRFNAYTTYVDNTMRDLAIADTKRDDRLDRIDSFGTRPEIAMEQRMKSIDARIAEIAARLSDFDRKR